MSYTRVVRYLFVSSLVVFSLQAMGCMQRSPADRQSPRETSPNIVYILADDLGYGDIGSYGQKRIKTPNLDRMTDAGMKFTQHYSGSTVCAPSRSVLLTGLHTGHTPIRGNKEYLPIGQHPLPYSTTTVAEVLKKAGYATGAFGKWGLGYPGSQGSPSQQGFDYFFGYNGQRRAHFYYPEFLVREVKGQEVKRVPLEGNRVTGDSLHHPGAGPPVKRGTYSQAVIVEEALSYIDRQKDGPFFLYLPLTIPHASLTIPDSAMKPYLDDEGNSIFKETPFPGNHYTAQPRPRAAYAAMITLLDHYVGQVLSKLKEKGIAQNTLVIFTSDNGPHLEGGHDPEFFNSNGPLRGTKRDLYEGGIRVPMIAWWPGTIPAGSESDLISGFQDIFPTLAELAGISVPPKIDGISMVPTLTGTGNQATHDYLYWEFGQQGGKQAVRMGKWKGVRLDVKKNPDASVELYNLEKDLGEKHNVASKHPAVVKKIRTIMKNARVPSEDFNVLGLKKQ